MKLIFTPPCTNHSGEYDSYWIGTAFKGYFQYKNIWIGKENRDFFIRYNHIYNFYDISLFEIDDGRHDKSSHIDKVISILLEDGNIISNNQNTFRWNNKIKIKGKRIWIQAVM